MEVDGDIPHGAHLGNASSPSQIIDWLVVWNIIFHILGINIPTDFHIGLKPPTRYCSEHTTETARECRFKGIWGIQPTNIHK
jgi:hypothetical protein